MQKHDNKYYLFYSANRYDQSAYAIGYATSDNPYGPFVKNASNPLIYSSAEEFSGPGNNSFFYSKDKKELFTAYHMHTNPSSPSGNRYLNIDRIGFRADGSVYFNGQTNTYQPIPSGTKEFHNLLSRDATIEASPVLDGFNENGVNDGEVVMFNPQSKYQYVAASKVEDAFIKIKFNKEEVVNSLYIYQPYTVNYRSTKLKVEFSNGDTIDDITMSMLLGEPAIVTTNGVKCDWVKITSKESGFGQTNFGINEVMIFGK
jgi:hypothetical protein